MNQQIVEEIISHFGRTGEKQRPRIRKFHGEILYRKFERNERIITGDELNRPKDYIDRMISYSRGFLEYINEEAVEVKITELFFEQMRKWFKQYSPVDELEVVDANLEEQGIILQDDKITFDNKLTFAKFQKLVTDEAESLNDPRTWVFSDKNVTVFDYLDFSLKDSSLFSSQIFVLKFYVLRKIDDVAFITSRFVHCPRCKANYAISASMTEYQTTYKCENMVGEKPCNTSLKKFPARKMLPTYIYEISVEVRGGEGIEFREFFLESFIDLAPGFYSGMVFGRTETKTNSFYFLCLTAKTEKTKTPFLLETGYFKHKFLDLVDCVIKHIKNVGFVIDPHKARLVYYIETLKRINLIVNKDMNIDHSLYFGAPGIGKTYSLNLLHHIFYSNAGFITGPRFSLAGLTGGQKDVYYQDTSKKKNVPGLFSSQAFLFDEINNEQFLGNDNAINLFKSSALAASGTSSVVGGKEFRRVALIAGTANYDMNHLRHYENKIKLIYNRDKKKTGIPAEQSELNAMDSLMNGDKGINLDEFDFYADMRDYGAEVDRGLKLAIIKVREDGKHFLTNFPNPLMERFYWTVLVHPKYDKEMVMGGDVDVHAFMKARNSKYSQRELLSQLFVSDFDDIINTHIAETRSKFDNDKELEARWNDQVNDFLRQMNKQYKSFYSKFNRVPQVHIYTLYTLSLINGETELSQETKRIYERLISLLHHPISIEDFHNPSFYEYRYVGESKEDLLEIVKQHENEDLRKYLDFDRKIIIKIFVRLENENRVIKTGDYSYKLGIVPTFEVPNNVEASVE
jgi:hypothetical protein